MATVLFSQTTGKVVGSVDGDVLRKSVSGKKHFLKKPPAIATDIDVLLHAEDLGVEHVVVFDKDTKKEYWAPIGTILSQGIEIDRGFGPQIALPLYFWQVRIPV